MRYLYCRQHNACDPVPDTLFDLWRGFTLTIAFKVVFHEQSDQDQDSQGSTADESSSSSDLGQTTNSQLIVYGSPGELCHEKYIFLG